MTLSAALIPDTRSPSSYDSRWFALDRLERQDSTLVDGNGRAQGFGFLRDIGCMYEVIFEVVNLY